MPLSSVLELVLALVPACRARAGARHVCSKIVHVLVLAPARGPAPPARTKASSSTSSI